MRLTAKKAVEISQELWVWLAKTGVDTKAAWPGWGKYGAMLSDCPLCEYAERRIAKDSKLLDGCMVCPLRGRWASEDFCEDHGSPFEDWRYATPERRKAAALRMVALFDKWLEEHS